MMSVLLHPKLLNIFLAYMTDYVDDTPHYL